MFPKKQNVNPIGNGPAPESSDMVTGVLPTVGDGANGIFTTLYVVVKAGCKVDGKQVLKLAFKVAVV